MSTRKLVNLLMKIYAFAIVFIVMCFFGPIIYHALNGTLSSPFFTYGESNPMAVVPPLIGIIIGFIIWRIWGKDAPIVAPISFYPPNGYNSAEIGMLYKGKAADREVVSLLMYLASQGYWTIEEFQENEEIASFRVFFQKNAYHGKNYIERLFFTGLYKLAEKDVKTGKKYVTAGKISGNFSKISGEILETLNKASYYPDIYEANKKVPCAVLKVMMVIIYAINILFPIYQYTGTLLIPAVITVIVIVAVRVYKDMYTPDKGYFVQNLVFAILCSSVVLILLIIIGIPAFGSTGSMTGGFVSILAIFVLMATLALMPRRSKKGTKLLGEIEGFKTFLTTAEKPRIEALVQENPAYFYDILPFAYVLDITLAGTDMFEDLAFGSPYWYHASKTSDKSSLDSMAQTMNVAEKSMRREY